MDLVNLALPIGGTLRVAKWTKIGTRNQYKLELKTTLSFINLLESDHQRAENI